MDHDVGPKDGPSPRGLKKLFFGSRRGNIAVMTALILPVLALATFGGVSVTQALSKRRQLADIAQTACSRAVKPTRMKILLDADRNARGLTIFDQMAADQHLPVTSRSVTSDWLTAEVRATAHIPLIENYALDAAAFDITVSARCQGLPPYPAKGDTILSSNFVKPGGDSIQLGRDGGVWCKKSWDVFKPKDFGWEGGAGPGVEIQDWTRCNYGTLPVGSVSKYVVELDSTGNSTMYRTVELHKGRYKFSFWYFGRENSAATNTVTVSFSRLRGTGPDVPKLVISRPRSDGWKFEELEIDVGSYSLYRLTIAAEGASDGSGGNFNDLKLEYIKRPGEV